MLRRGKLALLLFCAGGALFPLNAQKVVSARAGLITYLQGPAFLDGKRVVLKTARFPQMSDGQTLSTGRGRAEVFLSPGVVLRLAESSQLRMDDTQLSDTRVTLQQGEALIEVVQLTEGNRIQVALEETSTELIRAGLYRIGISPNGAAQNTLRVYGGEALVRSGLKIVDVKRGVAVNLNPDLAISPFDRKHTDLLHAWAARRSFELFMSDPDAREKQTHWQVAGTGYLENKNFGVVFRAFLRRGLPLPTRATIPSAEHP
jgi:ferric-dicitrate binding protein FerR (iron transport regulator)